MWILGLDDRLFWLLPNHRYVVGRASKAANEEIDLVVTNDTSVSRRHAVLEVSQPTEDATFHPSMRSEITVTDLSSRFGTKVDGKSIVAGSSVKLPQAPSGMVSIKLGSNTKLRLKWHSFVVTYSTGQTGKAHTTLWQHALNVLKPLDVKLMPYIVNSTDVFVKTGKSTSSLYYALTKNIPVANTQYFEALQAAATETSAKGTAASSVLPDVSHFLPDPRWAPDVARATCFVGCVFCVPLAEYAEALEPILTAAGASCVNANAPTPSEVISLYPLSYRDKIAPGTKYALESDIYIAITESRKLKPDEIHVKNSSGSASSAPPSKRQRSRVNVMEVMTSKSQSPPQAASDVAQGPPSSSSILHDRRKVKSRVLELMTSQESTALTQTQSPCSPDNTAYNYQTTSSASRTLGVQTEDEAGQSLRRGRKHSLRSQPSSQPSKKARISPDILNREAVANNEPKMSDDDEDAAIEDLTTIGELTVVESVLSSARRKSSQEPASQSAQARPNFKRFRKKGQQIDLPARRKLAFDFQIAGDENEREDHDLLFERSDDENSTNSAGRSSGKHSDLAQLTEASIIQGTPAAESEDEEESLFVRSTPQDSGLNPAEPTLSSVNANKKKLRGRDRRETLDDSFGFAFS